MAASAASGVDTGTGAGLAEAFKATHVVVDVTNSPSFEGAGVRHHLALAVVGADRVLDSGYMRARIAQERLIKVATVPRTVL